MKTDEELGAPWPDTLPAEAPVVFKDLDVEVGARHLTTLTRDHLHYWLSKLRYLHRGPFITLARANQVPSIQTYRSSENDYLLEVHPRSSKVEYQCLSMTLNDVNEVEQLLWDWLQNNWQRLDAIAWEHCTL
ncbi:hypothetical protein ACFYTS_19110 [Nocardia sp. NPDC004151]|uniref:hypothetical protein n=1 Tax=Nocardia sp. NPDC004151 TaxID=3364304 RepID=UPI0036BAA31E